MTRCQDGSEQEATVGAIKVRSYFQMYSKMLKHKILVYMESQSLIYASGNSNSYSLAPSGNAWMRAGQKIHLSHE